MGITRGANARAVISRPKTSGLTLASFRDRLWLIKYIHLHNLWGYLDHDGKQKTGWGSLLVPGTKISALLLSQGISQRARSETCQWCSGCSNPPQTLSAGRQSPLALYYPDYFDLAAGPWGSCGRILPTSESTLMQASTEAFWTGLSQLQWNTLKTPCSSWTNTGWRVWQQRQEEQRLKTLAKPDQ